MKNLSIAFLLVVILLMSSFYYKNSKGNICHGFPLSDVTQSKDVDAPLFLFLFFSKSNCPPCLEIIQTLNTLPPQFKVVGIVPDHELKEEKEIRGQTAASFKLVGVKKYMKFATCYTPTLIGVSQKGKIYFILPAVPEEKGYFNDFLESFYSAAFLLLLDEDKNK